MVRHPSDHRRGEQQIVVQALRQHRFGEHGAPELARRLGLPDRTLYNYETGEPIPGKDLVLLVERTEVSP
jgi:hypothetical protein